MLPASQADYFVSKSVVNHFAIQSSSCVEKMTLWTASHLPMMLPMEGQLRNLAWFVGETPASQPPIHPLVAQHFLPHM